MRYGKQEGPSCQDENATRNWFAAIYYRTKLNARCQSTTREFSCGLGPGSKPRQIISESYARAPGRHMRGFVWRRTPGKNCEECPSPHRSPHSLRLDGPSPVRARLRSAAPVARPRPPVWSLCCCTRPTLHRLCKRPEPAAANVCNPAEPVRLLANQPCPHVNAR